MSHEADLRVMIEIAVAASLPHATENDGKRVAERVLRELRDGGLTVIREGGTRNVGER